MLTLKNAMNAGTQLLNQGNDERLELVTSWTIPYQRFDGVLRHLDGHNRELTVMALTGFFDTFTAVHDYAQEHGFVDDWQVQDSSTSPALPVLEPERI
ncbi:MAG: hypothetical protein H0X24_07515 [Ktedonobacterales bacterium]|nr:hypothetical protein [Ktedonobacterales bacterium]